MGPAKKHKGSGSKDSNKNHHDSRGETVDPVRDPIRVLVACRPASQQAAVALHSSIRFVACDDNNNIELVHRLEAQCTTSTTETRAPQNIVRALAFSPDGRYLAVGGDDKALYVYDVDDGWRLRCRVVSPKKLACLAWMSPTAVLAANKYGDVFVVDVEHGSENDGDGSACDAGQCVSRDVMGHFCSVVLSLTISRQNNGTGPTLLSSTDRDGKVRVTAIEDMSKLMLEHYNNEIQSFCLGHRSYVSSGVFIGGSGLKDGGEQAGGQEDTRAGNAGLLLVTGGADGVKVWDPMDGQVLWEGLEDRKVLEMVGGLGRQVATIFDGEHAQQLAILDVSDGNTDDGNTDKNGTMAKKHTKVCTQEHDVAGLRKLSSASVDSARSVVWVVGARADGTVGLELIKIHTGDKKGAVERLETTVADNVLRDLASWTVPDSFFASYFTKNG